MGQVPLRLQFQTVEITVAVLAGGIESFNAALVPGQTYLSARSAPPDPAKAIAVFERACRGGEATACYSAGIMYIRGNGITKDPSLAQQRFHQACELGMKKACNIIDGVVAQLKRQRGSTAPR